jgi:hypothetical protein
MKVFLKRGTVNPKTKEQHVHCVAKHSTKRGLLIVKVFDLKRVNGQEMGETLELVGNYIRDKLPRNQSTIMVVDAREAKNFDLLKHTGKIKSFQKRFEPFTTEALQSTLLISPSSLVTLAFKVIRKMVKNARPVFIAENEVPWETNPNISHPTNATLEEISL